MTSRVRANTHLACAVLCPDNNEQRPTNAGRARAVGRKERICPHQCEPGDNRDVTAYLAPRRTGKMDVAAGYGFHFWEFFWVYWWGVNGWIWGFLGLLIIVNFPNFSMKQFVSQLMLLWEKHELRKLLKIRINLYTINYYVRWLHKQCQKYNE